MPEPPFPIHWSYEAWEALYGDPWARGWKPWPHEAEETAAARGLFLSRLPGPFRAWLESIPPTQRAQPEPKRSEGLTWHQFTHAEALAADERRWLYGSLPAPEPPKASLFGLMLHNCPGCGTAGYAPTYCPRCWDAWLTLKARTLLGAGLLGHAIAVGAS